ncbi:peptidase inhibitor family I36 protein [Kitasatospora sp. NPDC097605]|uniref:peptidase inhibitor family I36 protein n=1 Tax=Kitasatospora sp. NPDC097605 TaxID=3157226 RepID=UPI0033172D8B
MPKKTARLGLLAAAATGLILAAAPAASATTLPIGTGSGACPSNFICLWSDYDFVAGSPSGKYAALASDQNIADMGKLKNEGGSWTGMQDIASSVVNNTGSSICFYEHNGYGGAEFRIGPWEKWRTVPGWINDRISSFKYC